MVTGRKKRPNKDSVRPVSFQFAVVVVVEPVVILDGRWVVPGRVGPEGPKDRQSRSSCCPPSESLASTTAGTATKQ